MESFVPTEYKDEYYEKLIAFLEECLPQSGRALDLGGRHSFYKDIDNCFDSFLVMFDGEDIIGTAAVRRFGENDCELKSMYLLERYHGRGLGRVMAKEIIAYAKKAGYEKMYLDTFSTSLKAIKLYKKLGFRECEPYHQAVRADVFMVLGLGGPI